MNDHADLATLDSLIDIVGKAISYEYGLANNALHSPTRRYATAIDPRGQPMTNDRFVVHQARAKAMSEILVAMKAKRRACLLDV